MASIRTYTAADGSLTYRVQVRLRGHVPQYATFARKTDAKLWAAQTEATLRARQPGSLASPPPHTVADLCDRYLRDVLPDCSARHQRDQRQLLAWWRSRIGHVRLADVTPALIAAQRDDLARYGRRFAPTTRAKPVAAATLTRYLAALSVVFTCAVKEWGWLDSNPIAHVRKPRAPNARVRFLSDDERTRLLAACRRSANPYLYPVVVIALSTGARLGEILQLTWPDIDFVRGRAHLQRTKNGDRRTLFLSPPVLEELRRLQTSALQPSGLLFPSKKTGAAVAQPMDLRRPWLAALQVASVENFRFHDLRHTAASYLAMQGATLAELSEVLGHRTLAMVKRYAHLSDSHTQNVVLRMNQTLFAA